MAYPDELLELARHIANLYPREHHQASLRRAISTAYYAFFHFLISEATMNWSRPELRGALARVFDHGPMKQAADKKVSELNDYFKAGPPEGHERFVAYHLYKVADVFALAQQRRHQADYDTVKQWDLTEVLLNIDDVADAFNSWNLVRDAPAAQAFLVSMLPSRERQPQQRPLPKKRPTISDK